MSDPIQTIEETFSPSTVATYQAIKDSLEHGFCTLSNRELAEKAGCSERSVKRALSTLTDQGLIFSSRKGGKRRISLDRFPSIDRQAKLKELCAYIEGFKRKSSSGLFYEGQKATAKKLGISVPVLAEVYRLGEKQGVLRAYRELVGGKEQLCWEVVASDATEAHATALPAPVAAPDPSKELEALRAELAELREREANLKEALSALTSALSAEKEARAKAEEQLTQAADEPLILVLMEENAALVQKNESLEREVIQLKGQLAKIEIGECQTCQERKPSNLENAYIVERQLTSFLLERVEIPREELDDAMRDRIKDLSLIPHWENRFAQLDGFQVTSKDQEEEFGGDQEEESGENQEEESDEEPRSWLLPLPELELNPFPYRVDLEEIELNEKTAIL